MSDSSARPAIPLVVKASDNASEIFLVDEGLNRIASGIGELRMDVRPGIYKVRLRSGRSTRDEMIEVSPRVLGNETAIEFRPQPVQFASAAPLPGTLTTHEYHEDAWRLAWTTPDANAGNGASLFVLVRDPAKIPGKRGRSQPWKGVSIQVPDHATPVDAKTWNRVDADRGFAIFHASVNPGTCILRIDTGETGRQAMAIPACRGWQTQVILATETLRDGRGPGARPSSVLRAAHADASVFLTRPDTPGFAMDQQLRLTELAKQALGSGRAGVSNSALQDMLWTKFSNPMLGIFGAWTMLSAPEPNLSTLNTVLSNLEQMIPDHPDVMALNLTMDRLGPKSVLQRRFDAPPLLLRSWTAIVEASAKHPNLVPPDSLAGQIGHGLIGGGPWLIWGDTSHTKAVRRETSDLRAIRPVMLGLGLFGAQPTKQMMLLSPTTGWPDLDQLTRELGTKASAGRKESAVELTPLQNALTQQMRSASIEGTPTPFADLVRRLGVPASTLEAARVDLISKLGV